MARKTVWLICGLVFAGAVLSGCQRQFTRERYETIYEGQPDYNVRSKLGRPTRDTANLWTYVNEKPEYYRAEIWFQDGRVVRKRWSTDREVPPGP